MVTNVNRAAVQLLGGRSETEFLKPVRYIFEATPDAAIRVMTAHFNGARNHIEELKVNTFDGRVLDVLFLVTYPQPPEDQTTTFISMIDITDRLGAEAQLRQLQADFAHAARISTLGELVASIAHEVKQPLTAIITNGGTGLRWLSRGDASDKVAARIERIIDSAEQANEIIQRIQRMAAKREPVWTDLDLNEVIDEALQFVRHESVEKNISIVTDLDRAMPLVRGDRVQLQQVLVNLLVNSLQAIDASQSRERIVQVRSTSEHGWIGIVVSDSGPGIPAENLDQVFNGFFTTKKAGMGIGLTICQTIVACHGGSIEAANLAAGGTVIRFRLPESGTVARPCAADATARPEF
jgi:C4-dicarboxylate-specific signal transduction histidine kinase